MKYQHIVQKKKPVKFNSHENENNTRILSVIYINMAVRFLFQIVIFKILHTLGCDLIANAVTANIHHCLNQIEVRNIYNLNNKSL